VNFCVGDWIYWLGRPAINYRGRLSDWPDFLEKLLVTENVTDIIYYADCRPYHMAAAKVARTLGIRSYVFEFGYLRPDWLTLERGGMTGASHFPVNPEAIKSIGAQFHEPDLESRYSSPLAIELTHEIFYHLSTYFFHIVYPNYESDRYYNPFLEYLTGIPQQLRALVDQRFAQKKISALVESGTRYFLMPLQLQNDYQLRYNADYTHQSDAIREIISSFAAHADDKSELIFKCHPLDNGGEGWPKHIREAAIKAGVDGRVHYIFGGNLDQLLTNAAGVVVINSTVGMRALVSGCPTKVLGRAIYDIEGLTDRRSIDDFWEEPLIPDAELTDYLVRALAGTIQIKGSFFTKSGQKNAISMFVERLISQNVNGAGAFVDKPPRMQ